MGWWGQGGRLVRLRVASRGVHLPGGVVCVCVCVCLYAVCVYLCVCVFLCSMSECMRVCSVSAHVYTHLRVIATQERKNNVGELQLTVQ